MQYLVSPLTQGGRAAGIHTVNQQPIWWERHLPLSARHCQRGWRGNPCWVRSFRRFPWRGQAAASHCSMKHAVGRSTQLTDHRHPRTKRTVSCRVWCSSWHVLCMYVTRFAIFFYTWSKNFEQLFLALDCWPCWFSRLWLFITSVLQFLVTDLHGIMYHQQFFASLTDDSVSKVAKIVVRHKMVFTRAEGYVS